MADQQGRGIAWCEETWNPLRGCSRISAGCTRCYAERVAARFSGKGMAYEGLARNTSAGPRWTGKVVLVEEHLHDPLKWQRPRRIFVNSMSDVFHESVTDATIARIFAVMLDPKAAHHTFQLLTKRAERMREWSRAALDLFAEGKGWKAFPNNLWHGVSVEDQDAADIRVPDLVATPAAVRWLSVEPQIGPVILKPEWLANLHWVVVGGESGPDARPFDLSWARALVNQCQAAKVPVFVKQLGAVPMITESSWRAGPSHLLSAWNRNRVPEDFVPLKFSGKADQPEEWPADLRVREYPVRAA